MQAIADPTSKIITPESIMGAFSIVDHAINSTIHLFKNELGESEQQRKQRKVFEYIAKKDGFVFRKTLLSSRVLDGGVNEYDYVLKSLEATGQIEIFEKPGDHKNTVYKLSTDLV